MTQPLPAPHLGEPYLLTPGPLTTSYAVKAAMLRDHGSWDGDFCAMTAEIRKRLVALLGDPAFDCVPMQGSGSFAVEAMLGSFIPRDGRALVLANGAYGQRAAAALRVIGRGVEILDKGDFAPPRGAELAEILAQDPSITHVVAIHCETSSGILNPLPEIARAVAEAGRRLLVDSMSAFGGVPFDTAQIPCDAVVSSANKCIEGVPGFGFVLARRELLERAQGNAHSLALDVHAQWAELERSGQWRYTPPTHAVAAFLEALRAHEAEGGTPARHARYCANRDRLVTGMRGLGFATLLADEWLSPIITTFHAPADPAFEFDGFYDAMKARGFIIYPGKLTKVDSFRLGHIGQMDTHVMARVVAAVADSMGALGVRDCRPAPEAIATGEIA
ncbi:2-aminoethylphosphonate--pyruvate transaminase [Lacimonas salitolerans]|uniref:2-aminoethylphosphonate--pyruvate transaminase n=1 Tax=Lacimonas salitolerans TaxID=1323750 RepID=A0ABW4ELG7_9RHOB